MTDNNYPEPSIKRYGEIERTISACVSRRDLVNSDRAAELEENIWAKIANSACEILSLDVFDTLLLRNNKSEAFRFHELSELLLASIESTSGDRVYIEQLTAEDLYLTRSQSMVIAYRTARTVNGGSEGNIHEVIGCQLNMLRLPQQLKNDFLDREITYEIDNLTCNTILKNIAERFQRQGGQVILISDMYLGRDVLEPILDKLIPDLKFDRIYSSADTLVNKRSKTVFKHIETGLDKDSAYFFHIGDNWLSDVVCPRESGWQALHFPVSEDELFARNNDLKSFCDLMEQKGLDVSHWAKI